MIELLFQFGFAVACAITATSTVFWALVILPGWLRKRRQEQERQWAEAAEAEP
jgi:hypothetical protein